MCACACAVAQNRPKMMRWLTEAKHIKRTSYAALKVDLALAVISIPTADQLRLRRRGGWKD